MKKDDIQYPEGDIRPLAGDMDESTAWRLIADMAGSDLVDWAEICPPHIMISGNGFDLNFDGECEDAYIGPEGYEEVWALGATVFYMMTGCNVFMGNGGKYQRATTPIPALYCSDDRLASLVSRMLAYDPATRPRLDEIASIAGEVLDGLKEEPRPLKRRAVRAVLPEDLDTYWPEQMI